jgi:LemA protein
MDSPSIARIDRMEADGVITPKQAEMLRASLSLRPESYQDASPKRSLRLVWFAVGLVVLIVGLVILAQLAGGPTEVQDVSAVLNQAEGVGAMNRSLATVLIVVLFVAVGIAGFLWTYNGLVNREERVLAAWGQVESNLQRRADLTPQLVETVSRYLRHEQETFQSVAEARAQETAMLDTAIEDLAQATKESAEQLQRGGERIVEDEESLRALAAAQAKMNRSIQALVATAEAYPELRSSDQFLELQAQLEGTENRLNVTRLRFNELVGEYNSAIRRIPGTLVAAVGNFRRKAYFQAEQEARDAPDLNFD